LTAAVAFLRASQQQQTDDLARLLGCSIPEWTTLYGLSMPEPPLPLPERRLKN
jgi:hypothetical protein